MQQDHLQQAVAILHVGGVVAFPTETVYGLGADALNETAVRKVFQAKGRPSDNPLIVHIASMKELFIFISELPETGKRLAEAFWPGPMTLILKRNVQVPNIVTANLDTVAIRIPNHPVTLALLKKFGGGLVGPSANTSGKPSPTTAQHVQHDLEGKIDAIIDAGETTIGVESTVIDVTVDPPMILRYGGLSKEEIESVVGKVQVVAKGESLKRSPGTRHRHYAPNAEVILIEEHHMDELQKMYAMHSSGGKKVGVVTHSILPFDTIDLALWKFIGPDVQNFARKIFACLRELDSMHVDVILVERVPTKGLGAAVMDRLSKAAHYSTNSEQIKKS